MPAQVVVAGALIIGAAGPATSGTGRRLLVAQRARPPELAGRWELPGGKVGAGETEPQALARELAEELGITVAIGPRLGDDVPLTETMTLRAYLVTHTGGTASPNDHRALRWVTARELDEINWVPADRAWLGDLASALQDGPP